jgi:hypothetical protein
MRRAGRDFRRGERPSITGVGACHNSRIARRVRQTRNVTYEKSDPAKKFFTRFPGEIERFGKFRGSRVRQTRTRFGCYEGVSFDK